jgi:hypothetical protein
MSTPIRISVRADLAPVRARLARLSADMRDKAIAAAINRTADQAKTAAVRDIRGTFNLDASYIRNRIRVQRANARGVVVEATIRAPGKRAANLIRFVEKSATLAQIRRRSKRGESGVYVQIKRQGGKRLVKGAFISNAGRTVFRRIRGSGPLRGRERYAGTKHAEQIEALTTLDVPQALFSSIGRENLTRAVRLHFPRNLAHEVERLIKGYGKR